MLTYCQWMNSHTYYGKTTIDATREEAALHFFYDGVSPWITGIGYRWSLEEKVVSRKFVRFCYDVHCAIKGDYEIVAPEPRHRNYQEDRETFDSLIDTNSLIDFLSEWDYYDELIGTRLEYLLLEFCYTWVDVTAGKPGNFTHATLAAEEDEGGEEDRGIQIPDAYWSRRQHDLY